MHYLRSVIVKLLQLRRPYYYEYMVLRLYYRNHVLTYSYDLRTITWLRDTSVCTSVLPYSCTRTKIFRTVDYIILSFKLIETIFFKKTLKDEKNLKMVIVEVCSCPLFLNFLIFASSRSLISLFSLVPI